MQEGSRECPRRLVGQTVLPSVGQAVPPDNEPPMHAQSKSSNSFFFNKITRKTRSSCAVFAKIATKNLALVVIIPICIARRSFRHQTLIGTGKNRQPIYFQQFRLT